MEVTIQAYREENREDIERMEWEAAFVKADILDNLEEFAACGMVATIQNEVVGIGVFTGESKKVSVSLYIEPAKRQQGIGRKLLKALEGHMREVGVKAVVVDFKVDEGIHSFWIKEGYKDWFKSQFMLREGENTVLESCDIRPYEDRDYPECQKISSVAFHEMRTLAGLESKAAEPSETGRRACEERRNEIFHYGV